MTSKDFGFTCPSGGQWYACAATGSSKFVGCCTSDPCSNGCVQGNIRPGGFNVSEHGNFPDASCGASSNFYACGFAGSFWGCCKTDACKNTPAATCNNGDLVPAFMERPEQLNVYAPSAIPSPSATPGSSSDSGSGSSNTAVIGGAVGGGVVVLIIVGLVVFLCLRRRRRNGRQDIPDSAPTVPTSMMKGKAEDGHSAIYGQTPPPTYDFPHATQAEKSHMHQTPYHDYRSDAQAPQELAAEMPSSSGHRYSELPDTSTQRYSELPADAAHAITELASPQVSPRPLQTEFATDLGKQRNGGLDAATGEQTSERR